MTAPADRLLAAADLLDKRAAAATPEMEIDDVESGLFPEDIVYIATTRPEVGKAQAAMLRVLGSVDYPEVRMGVSVHTQKVFDAALALADLLLAGGS